MFEFELYNLIALYHFGSHIFCFFVVGFVFQAKEIRAEKLFENGKNDE